MNQTPTKKTHKLSDIVIWVPTYPGNQVKSSLGLATKRKAEPGCLPTTEIPWNSGCFIGIIRMVLS